MRADLNSDPKGGEAAHPTPPEAGEGGGGGPPAEPGRTGTTPRGCLAGRSSAGGGARKVAPTHPVLASFPPFRPGRPGATRTPKSQAVRPSGAPLPTHIQFYGLGGGSVGRQELAPLLVTIDEDRARCLVAPRRVHRPVSVDDRLAALGTKGWGEEGGSCHPTPSPRDLGRSFWPSQPSNARSPHPINRLDLASREQGANE